MESFLAPYMLWGALAASIPVALHFFFRSRYRTVPWAAMKFLLTSVEQTSRRLRFQELLLLLLRVAVLVLLAVALARPLSTVVGGTGQGEAVDAVFVFDTSYSMDAADGPRTRLQRAQDASLSILDQLPPHSTVQIIRCADRAELLGPRSPANLDQAKTLIQDLKTDSQATDLSFGITEAAAVLKRSQASNKELYVFSDMQKLGWEQRAASLKQTLLDIKEKAAVHLVRCGTRPIKNAAVVGISSPAGVPRPGERVDFAVLVRNTGKEPMENLDVSLLVDGDARKGENQVVARLEAGETRAVTLTAKLEKAGLRILTAQIKQDDMPGDNRFDHVMQVREQTNCLVVDGNLREKADEAVLSSSYFLMHALLPVKEGDYTTYWLQPRLTNPRLASPALLNKQDLCILVNVPMPVEDKSNLGLHPFLDELKRFVRDGHSLIIFCGDNVVPKAYNHILGEGYGLLPLPLKKAHKFDAKDPIRVNRDTFNLPAYRKFKEDEYFKDFGQVAVFQAFEVDETAKKLEPSKDKEKDKIKEDDKENDATKEEPEPDAAKGKKEDALTVALRYSNGMPAVVSRKVGAGEVILVTTAAELGFDAEALLPTWSDWPLNKFYGPFLQVTVNHLLHGVTQDLNVVAGKTLQFVPAEKKPRHYTLVHPDGKEVRLGLPEKAKSGQAVVSATDLAQAGVYRMVGTALSRPEGASELPAELKDPGTPFAVIPDLRESEDLDAFSDLELNNRLGFTPRHLVAGSVQTQETGSDRLNREWTSLFLVLVFLITLAESFLAWWCGRAW